MLPRPGFGNQATFAHPPCQQRLSQAVIDLVGSRVQEVFPLQVNSRSTQVFTETGGKVEWCGPPGIVAEQSIQLLLEPRIGAGLEVSLLQLLQRAHQGLWRIAAAVGSKMTFRIRLCGETNTTEILFNLLI